MTSRRNRPEVAPADLGRQNLLAVAQRKRSALLARARRHVGCRFLAEDILQDVMLRILEGDADADIDAAESYLTRMVRNLAIDRARRLGFESRLFSTDVESGETIAALGVCPTAAMQANEALNIVETALRQLPERVNTAFRLHRFEGVAQKDVAQALGVSRALVCEFVRRGHEHCLRALAEDGVSDCARARAVSPLATAKEESGRYGAGRRLRKSAAGDHAVESP